MQSSITHGFENYGDNGFENYEDFLRRKSQIQTLTEEIKQELEDKEKKEQRGRKRRIPQNIDELRALCPIPNSDPGHTAAAQEGEGEDATLPGNRNKVPRCSCIEQENEEDIDAFVLSDPSSLASKGQLAREKRSGRMVIRHSTGHAPVLLYKEEQAE